ncbi:MAG: GMC family oxidoreductase N-terminal domain-containing protein [Myxococcota bacterium]
MTASARHFDVIVVGSGAGGAPLAALLAEAGRHVCILEAGGPVEPTGAEEALARYYLAGGTTVAVGNSAVAIPVGKALGGTTAINSGTCLRPPDSVIEGWDRALGSPLFAAAREHLAAVERDIGVTVPPLELLGRSHHLFLRGLEGLDLPEPFILPRNAPGCRGSGMCCFGCPTRSKQSTDLSYVPRATAAGASLRVHTEATCIRPERGGVRVRIRTRGRGHEELLCDELVLAGGAFGTVRMIRQNRLGSRWRRAGDHMTVHPATKVTALFPEPVHGERGVPQGMGLEVPHLPGLTVEGIFTPADALIPLFVAAGNDLGWWLDRHDHLACMGMMITDRGRGSVRYLGSQPVLRYHLHRDDVRTLVEGLKLLARVYLRAGATRVQLPIASEHNEVSSEREVEQIDAGAVKPRQIMTAGFHPLGTAAAGRVVDPELRLVGEPRIRVCDGAVLPGPPGVNPQLTIMATAHHLAHRMTSGSRAAA